MNAKRLPRRSRRATVAVLTTISLTALIMVLAVTLDGGMLYAEKRHAQATADAAALAGAATLFQKYPSNAGVDKDGSAAAGALAIAASNGYGNDGNTSVVTIRTAGQAYLKGPKAGNTIPAGAIEVNVTYYQTRFFSAVMGSGTIPVSARAVAAGRWDGAKGVIDLAPSGKGLNLNGSNASIEVKGGGIVVDSKSSDAVSPEDNKRITADGVYISGPGANHHNFFHNIPPTPDPLAGLPVPAAPANGTITTYSNPSKITDGNITKMISEITSKGGSVKNVYVLTPGTYGTKSKLKNYGNGDLVIFRQASAGNDGLYYLESSGLTANGANLRLYSADSGGIMIYNNGTGQNDKITFAGSSNGTVELAGRDSGVYTGMVYFQNRKGTQPVNISGNGSFNVKGTVYAAAADLSLSGNGSSNILASSVVTYTTTISGNGKAFIDSSNNTARYRVFRLVE